MERFCKRNLLQSMALMPSAAFGWTLSRCVSWKPINTWESRVQSCRPNVSSGAPADWLIENLDHEDDVTSSEGAVGESDTLPSDGLRIGIFHITSASSDDTIANKNMEVGMDSISISLLARPNGWGSGVHPTTCLCLDFLQQVIPTIECSPVVLDYGCGSGILSIAALGLGACHIVGVDVEAEALVTSHKNLQINGFKGNSNDYDEDSSNNEPTYELLHTRQIQPYDLSYSHSGLADICVANILIGQLVRPSMVAALVTNIRSRGFLCLSGIRPGEVDALKAAYNDHVDWEDSLYKELSAQETKGSIESYGFDVGKWARVVGRIKANHKISIDSLSDLAVS